MDDSLIINKSKCWILIWSAFMEFLIYIIFLNYRYDLCQQYEHDFEKAAKCPAFECKPSHMQTWVKKCIYKQMLVASSINLKATMLIKNLNNTLYLPRFLFWRNCRLRWCDIVFSSWRSYMVLTIREHEVFQLPDSFLSMTISNDRRTPIQNNLGFSNKKK